MDADEAFADIPVMSPAHSNAAETIGYPRKAVSSANKSLPKNLFDTLVKLRQRVEEQPARFPLP
jgi:hypothetical protein